MFKSVLDKFKSLEKLTFRIMKNGFKFCFGLALISCIILLVNIYLLHNPIYYHIGLGLFKLSITFFVEFIICGFSVDLIKKQII